MNAKTKFASLGIAALLVLSPSVALANTMSGSVVEPVEEARVVTVEYKASWDYGSVPLIHGWSNLTSGTRWHSSTVVATGKTKYSGRTAPGYTSWANLWLALPTFSAYYSIW